MTDTSDKSAEEKILRDRWWLPNTIVFGLLFLNAILFFIPGKPVAQGVRVFFWQRYNNYLYQLQWLLLGLVPILAIGGGIFRHLHGKKLWHISNLMGGITSFFLCLFIIYSSIFLSGYVSRIGTVRFNEHVYHLVRYDRYDEASSYYFGECDQSGFWCVFQGIYRFFVNDPGSPQITISDDEDLVLVKMGSNIVYAYDGKEGNCIDDATIGWCIESLP